MNSWMVQPDAMWPVASYIVKVSIFVQHP